MEGAWQETNTTSMDVSREKTLPCQKISKTNIFEPSNVLCRSAEKLIFPQAHHGTQTTSREMTELANVSFFYDESIANFPHKLMVKFSFDQK